MMSERPTKNFRLPTKSKLMSGRINCSAIGLVLYLLCGRGVEKFSGRGAFARTTARRMRRGGRRFGLGRGGLGARLAACRAQVLLIVGVFGEAVIERMAHLQAIEADVINPLDGLVDALAIEDLAA